MNFIKKLILINMFIMLITTCVIAKDIKTFNHDELLSEYERSDEEYQKYVNEGLPYRIKYQDYNTGKITFEYFNCDASEYENETVAKTKSTKKKSSKKNKKKVEVENNVSSSIDNEKMKYLESIRNQNDEEKNVGWVEFNGAWYYQDESGNNKSGWQYIGDKWYYFDPETCVMITGLKELNGKKYCFDNDGAMVSGEKRNFNGNEYYFDINGEMTLNKDDNNKKLEDSNKSNWKHINMKHGINYDGPKKIFCKDADIELLEMNTTSFDLVNWRFWISYKVRVSNFKLNNVKRDNLGDPYIEFMINGYDENDVLVESKKITMKFAFDENGHTIKELHQNDKYERIDGMYFPSRVMKIAFEEYIGQNEIKIEHEQNVINKQNNNSSSVDLPQFKYIYGADLINTVFRECIKYYDSAIAGNKTDITLLKEKVKQLESLINTAKFKNQENVEKFDVGINSELTKEYMMLNAFVTGWKGYISNNKY